MQRERERQAKPRTARSLVGPQYLSHNATDHTVTFALGPARWEYWLNHSQCQSTSYLAHHISTGKAFAYAKRHATRSERLPPMPIDAYTVYCAHQRERGQPAPTREWWNLACAKALASKPLDDTQFDIETERREGWGYDHP